MPLSTTSKRLSTMSMVSHSLIVAAMIEVLTLTLVLARDMVKEIEHPTCGRMKLVNTPVKYSHSEPSIRTAPPTLGQHTDEILRDILNMSDADITNLKEDGVVT